MKLLVVDNSYIDLRVTELYNKKFEDIEFHYVDDVASALNYALNKPLNAIITDYHLHGETADELMDALYKFEMNLPVVLITGRHDMSGIKSDRYVARFKKDNFTQTWDAVISFIRRNYG